MIEVTLSTLEQCIRPTQEFERVVVAINRIADSIVEQDAPHAVLTRGARQLAQRDGGLDATDAWLRGRRKHGACGPCSRRSAAHRTAGTAALRDGWRQRGRLGGVCPPIAAWLPVAGNSARRERGPQVRAAASAGLVIASGAALALGDICIGVGFEEKPNAASGSVRNAQASEFSIEANGATGYAGTARDIGAFQEGRRLFHARCSTTENRAKKPPIFARRPDP